MTERQQIEELRTELKDIKLLLYGDPKKPEGGIAHSVLRMGEDIYGTEHSDGLICEVKFLIKLVWIGAGIVTTLQFGLQVLFHFWKP